MKINFCGRKDAAFIEALNKLIVAAIDDGGDAGGPYFCDTQDVVGKMLKLSHMLDTEDGGHIDIVVCASDEYPQFRLKEK